MQRRAFLRALGAASLLTLSAAPASAQFGGLPKPPKIPKVGVPGGSPSDAQRATFRECEKATRDGMTALPTNFMSNAEARRKDLAKASALRDKANAVCTPDLRIVSGWDETGKRLDELRAGIDDGQHQLAILERYEPAAKAKSPSPADLDALAKSAQDYAQWATSPEQKRLAGLWSDKVEALRRGAAEQQSDTARRDGQAAEDRAMLAKHDALAAIDAVAAAMRAHASSGRGPIPAELYAQYEAQLKLIEAFNPTARVYYEPRLRELRAYDAWSSGAGAPEALAAVYEGKLVASGASRGKTQKVSFQAEKDWCYAILTHFDASEGTPHNDWEDLTKMRHALRFWGFEQSWQQLAGVCTSEPMSLSWGGALDFTGTTNVERFVVVGWAKSALPPSFAIDIRPFVDECDPVQYEERWLRPIPGTVAHRQPGDIQTWERFYPSEPQCAVMPGQRTNPDANRFGACVERVHKKYAPQLERAARTREAARTAAADAAAAAQIARLQAASEKEQATACGPTFAQIEKAYAASVDKVADAMTGQAYVDHVDRAKRQADLAAAHQAPIGKDGKPESDYDRDNRRTRLRVYDD